MKRALFWKSLSSEKTRVGMMSSAKRGLVSNEKRPMYIERDPNILRTQETSASQKEMHRKTTLKNERVLSLDELCKNRALFTYKETYVYGKGPMYMEADLLISQKNSPEK